MSSLSLKHMYKVYPGNIIAVRNFNLDINNKEFIVFLGPSGCGKSTTLRMIAGLEEISNGELYIDDKLVNDISPKDRDIAMVFQNYALYPHMTVYDNMAFSLKIRKISKKEIYEKVKEAAKILGIEHLLNRKPKTLSGGQRQRVAMGREIVRNPKVFLMDEPLSNLDVKLRAEMRTEIVNLHKKLQATFIYVTHDQIEAMMLGTRIVVMKDGVIQQVDNPKIVYKHPVNMFVAGFIGNPQMNFIDSKLQEVDGKIYIVFGEDKILLPKDKIQVIKDDGYIGKEVIIGIRPEHISDKEELINTYPNSVISADVEVIEFMGAETYLYLSKGNYNFTIRANGASKFKLGDKVNIILLPENIHLFDKESQLTIF